LPDPLLPLISSQRAAGLAVREQKQASASRVSFCRPKTTALDSGGSIEVYERATLEGDYVHGSISLHQQAAR
jgi:hypothetical protein